MEERRIRLKTVANCRDLGGMPTRDGRKVRKNLLLRSAELSKASQEDLTILAKEHRLTLVLDLRTSGERKERPDQPGQFENRHLPVLPELTVGMSHEEDAESRAKKAEFPTMEQLYRDMVSDPVCQKNIGRVLHALMNHSFEEGSVLWHCTEGKDRCGFTAALVLSILRVEPALIMEDYLITNEVNEKKAEMVYRQMLAAGEREEFARSVRAAYIAKESYLNAAFDAMEELCGSTENYLRDALGIDESSQERFRSRVIL